MRCMSLVKYTQTLAAWNTDMSIVKYTQTLAAWNICLWLNTHRRWLHETYVYVTTSAGNRLGWHARPHGQTYRQTDRAQFGTRTRSVICQQVAQPRTGSAVWNVSSRLKENVVNTSGSLPGNGSFQHKEGKGSCDLHATSHLHFRQNDLDLLRATAVT